MTMDKSATSVQAALLELATSNSQGELYIQSRFISYRTQSGMEIKEAWKRYPEYQRQLQLLRGFVVLAVDPSHAPRDGHRTEASQEAEAGGDLKGLTVTLHTITRVGHRLVVVTEDQGEELVAECRSVAHKAP
jgi:hypothetical protein